MKAKTMRPPSTVNVEITEKLKDLFRSASNGQVVTFEEMTRATGYDIRQFTYLLPRVRKIISKEASCFIESVRGVGYQRMPSSAGIEVLPKRMKKVRVAAGNVIVAADITLRSNDLSEDARSGVISARAAASIAKSVMYKSGLRQFDIGTDGTATTDKAIATAASVKKMKEQSRSPYANGKE